MICLLSSYSSTPPAAGSGSADAGGPVEAASSADVVLPAPGAASPSSHLFDTPPPSTAGDDHSAKEDGVSPSSTGTPSPLQLAPLEDDPALPQEDEKVDSSSLSLASGLEKFMAERGAAEPDFETGAGKGDDFAIYLQPKRLVVQPPGILQGGEAEEDSGKKSLKWAALAVSFCNMRQNIVDLRRKKCKWRKRPRPEKRPAASPEPEQEGEEFPAPPAKVQRLEEEGPPELSTMPPGGSKSNTLKNCSEALNANGGITTDPAKEGDPHLEKESIQERYPADSLEETLAGSDPQGRRSHLSDTMVSGDAPEDPANAKSAVLSPISKMCSEAPSPGSQPSTRPSIVTPAQHSVEGNLTNPPPSPPGKDGGDGHELTDAKAEVGDGELKIARPASALQEEVAATQKATQEAEKVTEPVPAPGLQDNEDGEGCEDEITSFGASFGDGEEEVCDDEDETGGRLSAASSCSINIPSDGDEDDGGCEGGGQGGLRHCSVALTDVFHLPLDSFLCGGCSRPYSAAGDSFTVDLKCQTLSITCTGCEWWAVRRVELSSKDDPLLHAAL